MTNKSIRDYINLIENAQREEVAEGAKWRNHPDAYDVDDEGNKTPRNPNSPKFGYDPLQRRSDTAGDAKTPKGKASALKTSLKMARGNHGVAEGTVYPNAQVIKSKNGKPVGEIYQDGNTWGCFHYRADRGADFLDSREDAIQELKLIHQENGRKTPDYTIKGEVEEGQHDETSPEAIAKINNLTRRS